MIIKPTAAKKQELIRKRMQMLLDSGREIDTELFAKNIGESITLVDQLADEIITSNSSHYEKIISRLERENNIWGKRGS